MSFPYSLLVMLSIRFYSVISSSLFVVARNKTFLQTLHEIEYESSFFGSVFANQENDSHQARTKELENK